MIGRSRFILIIVSAVALCGLYVGYQQWTRGKLLSKFATDCPAMAASSDWNKVLKVSTEWLAEDPHSTHARFWLGESLQSLGRYEEALGYLEKINIDQPRGVDAAIRVMNTQLVIKHQPYAALETAAKLLEYDPELPEPIQLRIHFFAMTFQRDKLLEEISAAIRCRADLPEHFVYLMILEDLSFRDGKDVVQRWMEHEPRSHELLGDSLFAHTILSKRDAALLSSQLAGSQKLDTLRQECFQEVQKRKGSKVLLELAMRLELEAGQVDRVGQLLDLVPESALSDPVFWLHRGKYSLDIKNNAEARKSLEKAIELHPIASKARGYLSTLKRLEADNRDTAKLQELAAEGSRIVQSCLQLRTSRDVQRPLLREISSYAKRCEATSIAHAIDRRGK